MARPRAAPRAPGAVRAQPPRAASWAARAAPLARRAADDVLRPDALTICFARRFATYKRANLLFRDPERLARLLGDEKPPGAADLRRQGPSRSTCPGKERAAQRGPGVAQRPRLRDRIVFLEDYDMHMARYLVQGADVWLNVPRRPLEASGTSGMKAAVNGALNLSVLDGWWAEGYSPDVRLGHRQRRAVRRPGGERRGRGRGALHACSSAR